MSLVWRIVSIPKDGDVKLNMELPFEFEDLRKFKDLDEVKNRETFIHKEDKSMVMINHGVITNPNKKMIFSMNTFADLIKGAKEKKLIKSHGVFGVLNNRQVIDSIILLNFLEEPIILVLHEKLGYK